MTSKEELSGKLNVKNNSTNEKEEESAVNSVRKFSSGNTAALKIVEKDKLTDKKKEKSTTTPVNSVSMTSKGKTAALKIYEKNNLPALKGLQQDAVLTPAWAWPYEEESQLVLTVQELKKKKIPVSHIFQSIKNDVELGRPFPSRTADELAAYHQKLVEAGDCSPLSSSKEVANECLPLSSSKEVANETGTVDGFLSPPVRQRSARRPISKNPKLWSDKEDTLLTSLVKKHTLDDMPVKEIFQIIKAGIPTNHPLFPRSAEGLNTRYRKLVIDGKCPSLLRSTVEFGSGLSRRPVDDDDAECSYKPHSSTPSGGAGKKNGNRAQRKNHVSKEDVAAAILVIVDYVVEEIAQRTHRINSEKKDE